MKKIFVTLLIAATALLSFSCKDEVPETTLAIVSTEISAPAAGVVQPIKFNASAAWTISADKEWITFDNASGAAGEVTVNATVAANTTYEDRSATISIVADTKTTEIKITQAMLLSFTSEVLYEIDAEAQTIEFSMVSNIDYTFTISEDAKSWISEVTTKAAPAESVKKFSIKANASLEPREGTIVAKAGDAVYGLIVKQYAEFTKLAEASAECLGRTMKIYDTNEWAYLHFNEFAIYLSDGDAAVTLAINVAEDADITAIPVGTFTVDATATHAENTFSIKPANGSENVYTTVVVKDSEIAIEDGEITISKEGNTYTIAAVLVDNHENELRYSFIGEIASVADKTFGSYILGCSFRDQYMTYFTTKANLWYMELPISKAPDASSKNINYVSFGVFGGTGTVDPTVIPVGTFTFAEEAWSDDSVIGAYANGNYLYKTGDLYSLSATEVIDAENTTSWYATEGSTVTISKNDNGTYKFVYDLKLASDVYDENYDFVETITGTYAATIDNVRTAFEEVDTTSYSKPVPDGSANFTSVMSTQAVGLYFGNKAVFEALATPLAWSDAGSLVVMGFNYVNNNYTVYLALNVSGWSFVKNFNTRYCNTPLPLVEYKFSSTVADDALLPIVYGTGSYCYVQNSYTGTKMPVTGGSVTLSNGTITYDLKATSPISKEEYSFTGSHGYSFYYARDNSTGAKNISLAK